MPLPRQAPNCSAHAAFSSPWRLAVLQHNRPPADEELARKLDEEDRAEQAKLRRLGASAHAADVPCYR
eukprot:11163672-Lingulodinium_polyedra.AAC.1